VVGTTGTGFLQNDACWRELATLPPGELRASFYVRIDVDDRPGVLARIAELLAANDVSIARVSQALVQGRARIDVVTHEAAAGRVDAALDAISRLPEVTERPEALPVISDRDV
jgi:homoserine dehydrogenase